MIVSKINLDIKIIELIKTMIFDDVLLINIFSNGVCITQNINNISNYDKLILDLFRQVNFYRQKYRLYKKNCDKRLPLRNC